MAKTKKSPAKTAKPSPKAATKSSAKAPAPAPAKTSAKAASKSVFSIAVPKNKGERLEIPAPDFQEWWDNLKAYAYKSPAALVVGIIAVWMALVLLFD